MPIGVTREYVVFTGIGGNLIMIEHSLLPVKTLRELAGAIQDEADYDIKTGHYEILFYGGDMSVSYNSAVVYLNPTAADADEIMLHVRKQEYAEAHTCALFCVQERPPTRPKLNLRCRYHKMPIDIIGNYLQFAGLNGVMTIDPGCISTQALLGLAAAIREDSDYEITDGQFTIEFYDGDMAVSDGYTTIYLNPSFSDADDIMLFARLQQRLSLFPCVLFFRVVAFVL